MALEFPNLNRSYDARGQRVRFWGYDRAMEVWFFVESEALRKLALHDLDLEADFLAVFDEMRQHIHAVARKLHGQGRREAYTLIAADF